MSAALSALIWWLLPLCALIGVLVYVTWVTKFKVNFQNKTQRSVGRFQRFQNSFDSKTRVPDLDPPDERN